ncbi:hypothetical protein [Microbacterium maritypicum]
MSEATRADLDNAISAHIADTFPGHYTSGWVVVVSSSTLERPNATNYRLLTADGQPWHIDSGLLTVGNRIMKDSWDEDDATENDDD